MLDMLLRSRSSIARYALQLYTTIILSNNINTLILLSKDINTTAKNIILEEIRWYYKIFSKIYKNFIYFIVFL